MRSIRRSFLLLVLLCSGCAHSTADRVPRDELSAKVAGEKLVKGKTTRKEVLERFGAPNSVMRGAGQQRPGGVPEEWHYWTSPPLAGLGSGMEYRVFRMTVEMDGAGVVQDFRTEEGTVRLD